MVRERHRSLSLVFIKCVQESLGWNLVDDVECPVQEAFAGFVQFQIDIGFLGKLAILRVILAEHFKLRGLL